jgi:hypothetical protein
MRTYDASPGEHIETAIKGAIALAAQHQEPVALDFNDTRIVVSRTCDPAERLKAWEAVMEEKRKAYWTPERLAEKQSKDAADQIRLDEHIAMLPHVAWADADAVCRWLCEFESRSFIHTKCDRPALLKTFADHGYLPNVNLSNPGESEADWKARVGQEGAMRYVIGQGLDGTEKVGCPHSMIHVFYERLSKAAA